MNHQGHLFIISAPSGAGKTSLVKAMLAQDNGITLSISHTTRAMRPGEVDGQDYHFVDEAEFLAMLDDGRFLESAHVHGARYGTAKTGVDTQLAAGADVILEIDWQGAAQIRTIYPNAISIFILPPAIDVLEQRLKSRGQDSNDIIAKRIAGARSEMAQVRDYDYVIINNDFNQALQEFKSIVCAERLKTAPQLKRHEQLIQTLT